MKHINHTGSLITIIISVIVLGYCGQVLAIEFSADMTEQYGDNSKNGKIYVKGDRYCMDIMEKGGEVIVIVDQKAKTTTVIPFSKKEYMELALDDMKSVMSNPFQAYKYTAEYGEEKQAGTEKINGYECDKFVVSMSGTEVVTQWVARTLNFPIKIVTHSTPERVMQLTNIKEGPVDDSRFKIPEGFTKWIDPKTLPVEPPQWADGIKSAPVMTPPFEQNMSAGNIIRIKPERGKSLAIKAVSNTESDATAKVIPFKDGHPLKEESRYNNFAQKGVICDRRHETPTEADEFVVYVYEGNPTVKAKWMEMQERTVAQGDELRYKFQGSDNVLTYLVNAIDSESVAVINYLKEDQPLSEEQIGPSKWRTIKFKKLYDVDKNTRTVNGDEIVIKVEKGKIDIKLGQFDSFKF